MSSVFTVVADVRSDDVYYNESDEEGDIDVETMIKRVMELN